MKNQRFKRIFILLLLTNMVSTSIAGLLVYGVLTGFVPGPYMRTNDSAVPVIRYQGQDGTGTVMVVQEKGETGEVNGASQPLADEDGQTNVLLYCHPWENVPATGSNRTFNRATMPEHRDGAGILPLVDRRTGITTTGEDRQFFF